jgi:hypothetical protein
VRVSSESSRELTDWTNCNWNLNPLNKYFAA